ncbi:PREDICTED: calcium-binding protein 39-like [Acropora digitifera]|uniref:calcium-binding protein 39-like n=1 Tax=Acropora digitifera TaxID=70779 RepID=UPI000779FB30|nr:PREDICTED: calcium-binding protein 39-like [Acropora digitifera]
MPLFSSSKKNPVEAAKVTVDALKILSKESVSNKKTDKALEDISKQLGVMKIILFGTGGIPCIKYPLVVKSTSHILLLSFLQCKKDVAQIMNNILRRQIGTRYPTVEYLADHDKVLIALVEGYKNHEIALNCGVMLRECIRYEPLARRVLTANEFYNFFDYVEMSTFDIASDAFTTFKVTNHQLLGELLLDRHNFTVMTKYISNPENLKLMMNMLKDKSRNIQFEAFHVFKVFVANPNKTAPIHDILVRNKEKLVEFLTNFHNDRTEDEQFNDEKTYLIKQIKEL